MNDDVTQRNAAGELEIRTVATTGDTSTNKDDVYTRDEQGRLAVRVSGAAGGGGGASSAADLSVDPAGMTVITATNAQTAFSEIDKQVQTNINDISDCKGDISALEIDKQDKLSAGNGIVIEDNTVSADLSGLVVLELTTED